MRTLQSTPMRRAGFGRSPEEETVADVMARQVTVLREQGLPGFLVVDSKGLSASWASVPGAAGQGGASWLKLSNWPGNTERQAAARSAKS